jgi:hypothetical protein
VSQRFWRYQLLLVVPVGFILLAWTAVWMATETRDFRRHGVARIAQVVAIDRVTSGGKTGTSYHYRLRIDGVEIAAPLRRRFAVGESVPVLTIPGERGRIIQGDANSSLFAIYREVVGGDVIAFSFPPLLAFMILIGPRMTREIWRSHVAWVRGYDV